MLALVFALSLSGHVMPDSLFALPARMRAGMPDKGTGLRETVVTTEDELRGALLSAVHEGRLGVLASYERRILVAGFIALTAPLPFSSAQNGLELVGIGNAEISGAANGVSVIVTEGSTQDITIRGLRINGGHATDAAIVFTANSSRWVVDAVSGALNDVTSGFVFAGALSDSQIVASDFGFAAAPSLGVTTTTFDLSSAKGGTCKGGTVDNTESSITGSTMTAALTLAGDFGAVNACKFRGLDLTITGGSNAIGGNTEINTYTSNGGSGSNTFFGNAATGSTAAAHASDNLTGGNT